MSEQDNNIRSVKEQAEIVLAPYLLELYHSGVKLLPAYQNLLVRMELVNADTRPRVSNFEIDLVRKSYSSKYQLVDETAISEELKMSKVTNQYQASDFENYTLDRGLRDGITKKDWKVSQLEPDDDFVAWINSINKGWQHKISNEKFNLYKEQAVCWKRKHFEFPEDGTEEQKLVFVSEERRRCLDNSIYAVEKYGIISDPFSHSGEQRFRCFDVQCFLLYMFDCGLSFMAGKPRQIGSTTVLTIAAELRMMMSKNFYALLVAQKGKKSEEIFEQKVKFPVNHFPHYLMPSTANWNSMEVIFQFKSGKGAGLPYASRFKIDAPSVDVINAGDPALVMLDEIGLNELLEEIILQGRPTIFRVNPETGELEMKKQLIAWGTSDTVSEAFEGEFKGAIEAWEAKDYRYGMIPVFINSFAKPGFTMKHYESEKAAYYRRKKKPGKADPKVLFHQTYPIYLEDMFIASDDTVIPKHTINKYYEKVLESKEYRQTKRGYFEPVFDTTVPTPNTDLPYRVIGSRFVPANENLIEEDSEFACAHIIEDPRNWVNRYYEGTDPIFSTSGHSKLSSVVWDSFGKKPVAYINFKASDYRFCYLQSLLLGLHYSQQRDGRALGIKHLLEINVGGELVNYIKDKGYYGTLIENNLLPENLQTSTAEIGIRKNANSKFIINKDEEICLSYADNIYSIDFWIQHKTFVKKNTPTGEKFGPKNPKTDWDDHIDGTIYSYIGAECYRHLKPMSLQDYEDRKKHKAPKMVYRVIGGQTILVKDKQVRSRSELNQQGVQYV